MEEQKRQSLLWKDLAREQGYTEIGVEERWQDDRTSFTPVPKELSFFFFEGHPVTFTDRKGTYAEYIFPFLL
jgi:hypothetical protein